MSGIKRRKVVKMNRLDERVEGQKNKKHKAGSPGLVVIGGDSCSRGCGFESQHWTFFSICYCKNFNVYLKRPQIMPIKKRKTIVGYKKTERERSKQKICQSFCYHNFPFIFTFCRLFNNQKSPSHTHTYTHTNSPFHRQSNITKTVFF